MSMTLLLPTIILIVSLIVSVTGESTAVVNTTTGPVQGQVLSTVWHSVRYASFKGIKYAKAPVGYLRFKPPVPVDPWNVTLNATTPGDECVQIDPQIGGIAGSEDCLFLNVFTPVTDLRSTPAKLKSVMVWIYGGAWVFGSSTANVYNPDFLLERDVVVVSLNYRLGVLGFLNLNHPNATGNAGLKDQNLALKWVQANIERFGGNPNNVTLFGESAGAASVGFHTVSSASAGLFHGAISMSGTPLVPWGFQSSTVAKAQAVKLAALIGTISINPATLLKAFYGASAAELVNATPKVGRIISFTPTIEKSSIATDVFISECSVDAYNSGNFNKVPQILGFMAQETVSFAAYAKVFFQVAMDTIADLRELSVAVPPFMEFFVSTAAGDLNLVDHTVAEALINETTDVLFISPIDSTQKILADSNDGQPVYYYRNSFYTDRNFHNIMYNMTLLGAGHADDLAEIFYIPAANYTLDADDPITQTIYRVTTMWTNFAKYGNPTPDWVDEYPLNVTWPVSGDAGVALDIGNELTVVPRPTNSNVKLIGLLGGFASPVVNGCL